LVQDAEAKLFGKEVIEALVRRFTINEIPESYLAWRARVGRTAETERELAELGELTERE
jgi:hypothetical protein